MLRAALLVLAATLALAPGDAYAQAREKPFRADVSAAGGLVTGNLGQAQATANAHLSHSAERLGYDVVGAAFRLWIRPAPGADMIRVGDTLSVMALPFWYLGEKPFLMGTGRYEYSQLRGIDGRLNGGASIGIAPLREEDRLIRISIGAQVESTRFVSAQLAPQWVADTDQRLVSRAVFQTNGWFRLERSRFSVRWVGSAFVNPAEVRDVRAFLDTSLNARLVGQFSARLGVVVLHDVVRPEGVQPTDMRTNVGLGWNFPKPERPGA